MFKTFRLASTLDLAAMRACCARMLSKAIESSALETACTDNFGTLHFQPALRPENMPGWSDIMRGDVVQKIRVTSFHMLRLISAIVSGHWLHLAPALSYSGCPALSGLLRAQSHTHTHEACELDFSEIAQAIV